MSRRSLTRIATGLLMCAGFVAAQPTQNNIQYVTAGSGGVAINNLVTEDTTATNSLFIPVLYTVTPLTCGAGFALAAASGSSVFPMSTGAGTVQTGIADAAINAGYLLTASSTNSGHLMSAGSASRASVPVTTCIVGVALSQTTAAGQTITLLYDGPGSYGNGNVNSNASAFVTGNLVEASGVNSTEDSGIAVANVVTDTSTATSGQLMVGAGSKAIQTGNLSGDCSTSNNTTTKCTTNGTSFTTYFACQILSTAICTSALDANNNPNFLAGSGATLDINGGTTNLVYFVGGAYQVINSNLSITLTTPASDTLYYIYATQDITNANPVNGDITASTFAPFTQYASATCPTWSGTNFSVWFDLSTNTTKTCTSSGGTYAVATPMILLGVALVTSTPTISAVLAEPFRLSPNLRFERFGTGQDGTLAVTTTTTKDSLFQYQNLLVDNAVLQHTAFTAGTNNTPGLIIYSQTPIIITGSSGQVTAAGLGSATSAAGTGTGASGTQGGLGGAGGGGGGDGTSGAGNGGTGGSKDFMAKFGQQGGGGSAGTGGTSPTPGGAGNPALFGNAMPYAVANNAYLGNNGFGASGGNGGGETSPSHNGGGGGNGGGMIFLKAPSILLASGSKVICDGANGSQGSGGNTGGGGGGGGGTCILAGGYLTISGTFTANAGMAGSATGTGQAGGVGGAGTYVAVKLW